MSKLALCAGFQGDLFALCQEESNRILKCSNLALFNLKKKKKNGDIFQNIKICYKEDYILLLFPKDRIEGQIQGNFSKGINSC